MGGRGSSSGNAGGTTGIQKFSTAGVTIRSGVEKLNQVLVNKTLNGVRDTLKEFGLPLSVVNQVDVADVKGAVAMTNGFNDLVLTPKHYASKQNEFERSNHVINSSAYGVGTHEAGHMISRYAMAKNNKSLSYLQQANLANSGKWDRNILKQAKKANGGKLDAISKYGSSLKGKNARETVAEAVSEYMKKGSNASASSRAIVKVLKSYL